MKLKFVMKDVNILYQGLLNGPKSPTLQFLSNFLEHCVDAPFYLSYIRAQIIVQDKVWSWSNPLTIIELIWCIKGKILVEFSQYQWLEK